MSRIDGFVAIELLYCDTLDRIFQLPHEQGAVVSCLGQHQRDLNGLCRKEIFRLAEMQSNDYHLDRALYYACREDRERLCGQVPSGNGRVYRCLYEKKLNSMMTPAVRCSSE
jgi:golgi apparatus protein 1